MQGAHAINGCLDDAPGSREKWDRLAFVLGTQVAFEVSTLVGYYAMLALQPRVFRVG